MKLLICTSTFESITHGPSKFVNNLLKSEFLQENTEIRILTEDVQLPIVGKIYKYTTSYPRLLGSFWEYGDNFVLLKEIEKIRKDFKPDSIIFINALLSYWTIRKLKINTKFVGFINDDEKLLKGSQFNFFSKNRIHALKARFLEKKASKKLDGVITCSHYLSDFVASEYNINRERIFTLYQGVDLKKFSFLDRSQIDLKKVKNIQVLFVKSDYERGGLLNLASSLNLLREYNFELVICGKFNFSEVEKGFALYSNLKVRFKGATSQKEVVKLMRESHILCIPALREGLGVANVEGLATGISVVATKTGGIPEVIGNGKFGWLAEPNNIVDLTSKLRSCILSPNERNQKSILGRKFVEKYFDKNKMAEQFYEILKSI